MHCYVHIPFCHRICPYCAFVKRTPGNTDMKRFVDALIAEAGTMAPYMVPNPAHTGNTLYFGGGTPSMLSNKHLGALILGIGRFMDITALDEFSFETNPATFTPSKVHLWAQLGITRVSLGVQAMDEATLKLLGRTHTPQQVRDDVTMLRDNGDFAVNLDLIFSVPGQSLDTWRSTLHAALDLSPDHISAYNLTYEEDTDFFRSLKAGQFSRLEEEDAAFFTETDSLLTAAGFRHYETSNFAHGDRHLSLHNSGYWAGDDYIGLGPGAVGTLNGVRYRNTSDVERYMDSVLTRGIPERESETITPEQFALERLGLMLRTDTGLPLHYLSDRARSQMVPTLVDEGLARTEAASQRLILTRRGAMVVDSVAAFLS